MRAFFRTWVFTAACLLGCSFSQAEESVLSLDAINALTEDEEYQDALNALMPLAEQNDDDALFLIGRVLQLCDCAAPGDKDAVWYLRRAAYLGNQNAQYYLGLVFLMKDNEHTSHPSAGVAWLRIAGFDEDGFLIQSALSQMTAAERQQADSLERQFRSEIQKSQFVDAMKSRPRFRIEKMRELATSGHALAQLQLGEWHYYGLIPANESEEPSLDGQPDKPPAPIGGFDTSAVQEALSLSLNFSPRDDEKAFFWLSKAAKQNITEAQVLLGEMNELGRVAGASLDDAYKWYGTAYVYGNPEAAYRLARLTINEAEIEGGDVAALLSFAILNGNEDVQVEALYTLSQVYWTGSYTNNDNTKAYALLLLSEHVAATTLWSDLASWFEDADEYKRALLKFTTLQQREEGILLANKCRLEGFSQCVGLP